jgi:hypothetical protein
MKDFSASFGRRGSCILSTVKGANAHDDQRPVGQDHTTAGAVDVPTAPPIELVAFVVRWNRGLRQWKTTTLADFARVSISTVERIERGEHVSDDALDRIAQAFGYEAGYFTATRLPWVPMKRLPAW